MTLPIGATIFHVHILFGIPLTTCISDLVGAIKVSSSGWVNEQRFVKGKFQWQSGLPAFS